MKLTTDLRNCLDFGGAVISYYSFTRRYPGGADLTFILTPLTCYISFVVQWHTFAGFLDPHVLFGHELVGITSLTWGIVPIMTLTWESVKSFTSPGDNIYDLPKMLNLEVLCIDQCIPRQSYEHPDTPFTLPSLHALFLLSEVDVFSMFDLLFYLVAPALRTLVLKVHADTVWTWNNEGDFFCNDNFPRLSSLSLEVARFGPSDIVAILTQTTSLTALYLSPNNAIPEVLEAMGTKLLPKLTSLRLHFSTMRQYTRAEHVISMIESRLSSRDVASLEEVRLVRSGKDEWYTVETM